MSAEASVGVVGDVHVYDGEWDEGAMRFVYVCDLCAQPLDGPDATCNSGAHVGPRFGAAGRAVPSTRLHRQENGALVEALRLLRAFAHEADAQGIEKEFGLTYRDAEPTVTLR